MEEGQARYEDPGAAKGSVFGLSIKVNKNSLRRKRMPKLLNNLPKE